MTSAVLKVKVNVIAITQKGHLKLFYVQLNIARTVVVDSRGALRTYFRIRRYWLCRRLELCVLMSCLKWCVCLLVLSCLSVRNINKNLSPCAARRPRSAQWPVWSRVRQRSKGRKEGCPVCPSNMKAPKTTGAGVFKWEGRARQSAKGVKKGCTLHRHTQSSTGLSACQSPRPWAASP